MALLRDKLAEKGKYTVLFRHWTSSFSFIELLCDDNDMNSYSISSVMKSEIERGRRQMHALQELETVEEAV